MLNLFVGAMISASVGLGAQRLRSANLLNRGPGIDSKKIEYEADLRRSYIQATQFNR
jgi:hypothetical protein